MKQTIFITLLFLVAVPAHAFAATAGPTYCATASDVNGPPYNGDQAWSPLGNACANDGSVATSHSFYNQFGATDGLILSNFGFAIPAGATINGIQVEVNRSTSVAADAIDAIISLQKASVNVGSNKATVTNWPTSLAVASYGGVADLWGTTWTASDINASTFGVAVQSQLTIAQSADSNVDFVRVTVTYTSAAPNFALFGYGFSAF